ncbi:MAG: hypothetical protein WHT29_08610 [Bacteroidales bacterium]
MKPLQILILTIIFTSLMGCDKENTDLSNGGSRSYSKILGYAQKGPFINGASVTLSELDENLVPTGKTFSAQILDNRGTFELRNATLASPYVELKVEGYYFDEVKNSLSTAPLILYALADVSEHASINVNVLTHLEKSRVDYLIAKGKSFKDAKKQAEQEILNIFEINKDDMVAAELLDLSKNGDDHAILLAVSAILQGHLSVGDLSELLANISTDIREDGKLDSRTLGSILMNNARTIDIATVRSNLEKRYETLGIQANVADGEAFIKNFINNAPFEFTSYIQYPDSGKYGINILSKNEFEYTTGNYSMRAILPAGTYLSVKISGLNWFFPAFQENTGWEYSDLNSTDNSRVFTATRTGEIDFQIMLQSYQDSSWSNTTSIYVYENRAATPTWSKTIEVKAK